MRVYVIQRDILEVRPPREMAEKREAHRDRYGTQLKQRLLRLDRELEKAYEGWKRGIVSDELFIPDHQRIQQERLLVESDLETVSIRLQRAHELAELGMELARDCGEAWRVASEAVRTKMAQALFERITIRQRRVVAVRFGEPFSSIFRVLLRTVSGGKGVISRTLLTRSFAD